MHPQVIRYSPKWTHVTGRELPRHLQIAYGRYVARLCHVSKSPADDEAMKHLWLVDSPTSIEWHPHAVEAYRAEMARLGIPMTEWVNAALPPGVSHFQAGSVQRYIAEQFPLPL